MASVSTVSEQNEMLKTLRLKREEALKKRYLAKGVNPANLHVILGIARKKEDFVLEATHKPTVPKETSSRHGPSSSKPNGVSTSNVQAQPAAPKPGTTFVRSRPSFAPTKKNTATLPKKPTGARTLVSSAVPVPSGPSARERTKTAPGTSQRTPTSTRIPVKTPTRPNSATRITFSQNRSRVTATQTIDCRASISFHSSASSSGNQSKSEQKPEVFESCPVEALDLPDSAEISLPDSAEISLPISVKPDPDETIPLSRVTDAVASITSEEEETSDMSVQRPTGRERIELSDSARKSVPAWVKRHAECGTTPPNIIVSTDDVQPARQHIHKEISEEVVAMLQEMITMQKDLPLSKSRTWLSRLEEKCPAIRNHALFWVGKSRVAHRTKDPLKSVEVLEEALAHGAEPFELIDEELSKIRERFALTPSKPDRSRSSSPRLLKEIDPHNEFQSTMTAYEVRLEKVISDLSDISIVTDAPSNVHAAMATPVRRSTRKRTTRRKWVAPGPVPLDFEVDTLEALKENYVVKVRANSAL